MYTKVSAEILHSMHFTVALIGGFLQYFINEYRKTDFVWSFLCLAVLHTVLPGLWGWYPHRCQSSSGLVICIHTFTAITLSPTTMVFLRVGRGRGLLSTGLSKDGGGVLGRWSGYTISESSGILLRKETRGFSNVQWYIDQENTNIKTFKCSYSSNGHFLCDTKI